jgi:hypothetical protein
LQDAARGRKAHAAASKGRLKHPAQLMPANFSWAGHCLAKNGKKGLPGGFFGKLWLAKQYFCGNLVFGAITSKKVLEFCNWL